ncbi:MAG: hypothetical protein HETSPECPRED_005546 [Heterodermia speciosa]|uniref:Uncharacterized protein n=1 Tax=Heterodermia speciosa TaxID=116794 RepID=A0A8H3FNH5_9LECA|nr:MAG: hypothetical protein HETSPECPRED_005546 [Heterodermia speciosa]
MSEVAILKSPTPPIHSEIMRALDRFRYLGILLASSLATLHIAVADTTFPSTTPRNTSKPSRTEPIDGTYSLLLLDWKPPSRLPSNNYYAAIVSAQSAIFAAFRTSPSPFIEERYTEFRHYGVEISFDNLLVPRMELTYALVGDALAVLAKFMLKMKICEVTWAILRAGDPAGIFISNGVIVKDPFGIGNLTKATA